MFPIDRPVSEALRRGASALASLRPSGLPGGTEYRSRVPASQPASPTQAHHKGVRRVVKHHSGSRPASRPCPPFRRTESPRQAKTRLRVHLARRVAFYPNRLSSIAITAWYLDNRGRLGT